jgi:hypothetical protein
LRDLAREDAFAVEITPAAERGWQQWQAMADEERDQLAADARRYFDRSG